MKVAMLGASHCLYGRTGGPVLQLVNLTNTKLYDNIQFFRFDNSIYDLSFLDIDKILP